MCLVGSQLLLREVFGLGGAAGVRSCIWLRLLVFDGQTAARIVPSVGFGVWTDGSAFNFQVLLRALLWL